jgi:hypothetical protein
VGCTYSISRRCGFIFVDESAEQVASSHRSGPCDLIASRRRRRKRVGRFEAECAVRPALVVVADVNVGDVVELAAAEDQDPVEALAACAAQPALDVGVRVRGLDRVRMIAIPSLWKMASKARLSFLSRSWIRKRGRRPRSSRSISRLRACWIIQARTGGRRGRTRTTRPRATSKGTRPPTLSDLAGQRLPHPTPALAPLEFVHPTANSSNFRGFCRAL